MQITLQIKNQIVTPTLKGLNPFLYSFNPFHFSSKISPKQSQINKQSSSGHPQPEHQKGHYEDSLRLDKLND